MFPLVLSYADYQTAQFNEQRSARQVPAHITSKFIIGALAFDVLAIITLIVVGILVHYSVIPLPSSASYAFLAVAPLWIIGEIAFMIRRWMKNPG